MIKKDTWFTGHNNYQKMSLEINDETNQHLFHIDILDVETENFDSIHDIFAMHLKQRQTKFVDVLYSGGIDSEAVLVSCLINKIPVRAYTMKLLYHGLLINSRELYYAEKFCRDNQIEQICVDLNVEKWFSNGDHLRYIEPYKIREKYASTYFYLMEQCDGFPVFAGGYCWPQVHKNPCLLSPRTPWVSLIQKFMLDKGIHGIGDMQSYSLESHMMFIANHCSIFDETRHDGSSVKLPQLKVELYEKMNFGTLEKRMKQHGWEAMPELIGENVNIRKQAHDHGIMGSSITWGEKIAFAMKSIAGYNNQF